MAAKSKTKSFLPIENPVVQREPKSDRLILNRFLEEAAASFHLYGIARDDVEYILSTFKGIHAAAELFSGGSPADRILEKYDAYSSRGP